MSNIQKQYPVRTTTHPTRGNQISYADVNKNNKYDRGDYVILSHQNKGGTLDERDAHYTSIMLNQMANRRNPDLNADGKVTQRERDYAALNDAYIDSQDKDSNGTLSGNETTYRPKSRLFGMPKAFRREKFALANDYNNDGNYSKGEINRKLSVMAVNRDFITVEEYSGSYNPFARRKLNVVK